MSRTFLKLLEVSREALRQRNHGHVRNPAPTIFIGQRCADDLMLEPPVGIAAPEFQAMIFKLWDGDAMLIRGIPVYLDDHLRTRMEVLWGTAAAQRMKEIRERRIPRVINRFRDGKSGGAHVAG